MITVSETGENSIIVSTAANGRLSPDDIAAAQPLIAAARVLLNLSPVVELPAEALALADPLIVTEHEAREILRRNDFQVPTENVAHAAKLRRVGARSVVVTFGRTVWRRGCRQRRGNLGVRVDAVDTTGAGDLFAATVAWLFSQGDLLLPAVRSATRVGACSVQHSGAQVSYPVLDRVLSGSGLPD
ncbi:PfkB family carbohydrate kinase [Saccharopolyspora sp. NPDC000995]